MYKMCSSRLLSKETLYTYFLCPIVIYNVKHSLQYIDEVKLLTFVKKILQKIHRPVQNGEYERKK